MAAASVGAIVIDVQPAHALTASPVADAYVRSDLPNQNYGVATRLEAGSSPRRDTLLRFAVSGVGANVVTRAEVRLFVVDAAPRGGSLFPVASNSWNEGSVTWNTAPPASTTVPLASLGSVTAGTWVTLDVTGHVTRDATYSFRLTSPDTNVAAYTSRQGTTANRPKLILTLTADTTPPTVSLTTPAAGSQISGSVPVEAAAGDGVGVDRVVFRLDGTGAFTDGAAPWRWTWDTTNNGNGVHTVQAIAYDLAGNSTASVPIEVTVLNLPDTIPPSAPAGLIAGIGPGGRVDLTWQPATDNVGVVRYEVRRDGTPAADPATITSYRDWHAQPLATYSYHVVAYDEAGNASAPSDAVLLTIPEPAPVTLKPVLGGLIDRTGLPDTTHQAIVNGFVVQVPWNVLQPSAGAPLSENNPIDAALAEVRALNAANPGLDMRLKIRILAGKSSPGWAKTLDGTAPRICDPVKPNTTCPLVPRFWTDRFGAAYQELHDRLAARYDGAPEIREVVASRCTTLYAEPFLRQMHSTVNLEEYQRKGYSEALDERCQRQQLDTHRVWSSTRTSLAGNPYHAIDTISEPPVATIDESFTERILDYCRQALGPRCVVGNNSLRDTTIDADYDALYTKLAALGRPLYFQTAQLAKQDELVNTLVRAEQLGANMVELPGGYKRVLTLTELETYDTRLEGAARATG